MGDEALDRKRPRRHVQLGGDLRIQYGPLVPSVILTGWETRISGGFPTTKESSCRLRHFNSLLRRYDPRYLEHRSASRADYAGSPRDAGSQHRSDGPSWPPRGGGYHRLVN